MAKAEDTVKDTSEVKAGDAFVVDGRPGFGFQVNGEGFGEQRGVVLVDGFAMQVTSWQPDCIKGILPRDIKHGARIVIEGPNSGGKQHGSYRSQR